MRAGLESSISPDFAITFERTRRIRSNDKPWHAIAILFNVAGGISCCSADVKRFNSSNISE
jgi:hypothetical protein